VHRRRKGLDPRLLRLIVERAHATGLRVSAHIVNGADFRNAVNAGVDEIVHIPAAAAVPAVERRMARVVTNALDEPAIREIAADLAQVNPGIPRRCRCAAKTHGWRRSEVRSSSRR
jgi:imidazolonepropionase-like amidohydrolase